MGIVNKTTQEINNIVQFIEGVPTGDDKGLKFTGGQQSTGAPNAGQEAIFGEGDSYPVVRAWHFDYANLSGTTITGATEVTDILQSDNGSTTGLFGGTAAGSAIIVMSDLGRYGGVKAKIDTLGTVEPANITAEYLADNTPTWVTSPYMVTDADFPYEQKGNVLSSCSSCSEQWRFGFDPDNLPPTWDEVTMTINGYPYIGRFAMFRVTSPITLDPVMEQLKLHTNRMEVNAEGSSEYFGRSRYPKDITVIKSANSDKTTGNQNISIASGITITGSNNAFTDNSDDGLILTAVLPIGVDTSIPMQVDIDWQPLGAGTGNVELKAEIVKVTNGFTYDGAATAISLADQITAIANQQNERQVSSFKFFVNDMLPGDIVVISIHRDARVTNPDDTLAGSIAINYWRLFGYFWKP